MTATELVVDVLRTRTERNSLHKMMKCKTFTSGTNQVFERHNASLLRTYPVTD